MVGSGVGGGEAGDGVHGLAGAFAGGAERAGSGESYVTWEPGEDGPEGSTGNLRGGVDQANTERLAKRLDLDLAEIVGAMSHGNRQKVGIVQAFQHDPELVILDEPTQGLDPLIQREFLELLREVRRAGRTVFLCSHVLSEVEAVADTVGILR